jgi:protein-disulfide isomerase
VGSGSQRVRGREGKFWEYHDKLFASQKGENQGAFAKEKLKLLAADLNLDMTKFSTCLESGKYASVVQTESQMVGGVGVKSTPTFLVNTEVVQGAQPFELFSQIIEAERGNSK